MRSAMTPNTPFGPINTAQRKRMARADEQRQHQNNLGERETGRCPVCSQLVATRSFSDHLDVHMKGDRV